MNGSEPEGLQDTIIALATPPGRSALAVLRLSGPQCRAFLLENFIPTFDWPSHARRQTLVRALDASGEEIDQALVSFFPAPHSYTGEDVVEISCHGSVWVCRRILETAQQAGIRLARPGEFTERAFLQGKIDLVQAEAIRDLIASQTGFQARIAREQLEGRLSRRLQPLKEELVRVISHLETSLEFVEDEVEPEQRESLLSRLKDVGRQLYRLEESFRVGKIVQGGLKIVVSGRPNVGKSSIFNVLMQEERAIVTDIPGTTRDALSERVNIEGVPAVLVDTAGIRETESLVEQLGVEKALEHLSESSIILFVLDGSEDFTKEDERVWEAVRGLNTVLVINKSDLAERIAVPQEILRACPAPVHMSALKREGLDRLHRSVWQAACGGSVETEDVLLTDLRHLECVREGRQALQRGIAGLESGMSEEFPLYDLRKVLNALGRLTGEVGVEEILDEIFSTFCIGK